MYYKGTYEDCINYDKIVSEGEGYSGVTKNFDTPIKFKDGYAIKRHPKYPSEMSIIENIPNQEGLPS